MAEAVEMIVLDDVALVTIDNPPVNALNHAVRQGLIEVIEAAEANHAVRAIVLIGAGRSFPAGADIHEFTAFDHGARLADPWMPEVCNRIEAATKPVVAALHGTALGGGFEVALAAHWRVAQPGARVGFPEVTLGLLPGAGGTQRAPRLAGAKVALDLMLSGRPISAGQALAVGLIDEVADDDLIDAALARARALADDAAAGHPPVRTSDRGEGMRDPAAYEAEIRARRSKVQDPNIPAPSKIVDCVEAALLLPGDAGHGFERAAFDDCLRSPASAGLRHAFLAERRTFRIRELAATTPREIQHVAVIGGGLMGAGITASLLGAGLLVTMVERDNDALAKGLERVAVIHQRAVDKGRLTEAARDAEWDRLEGAVEMSALAEVDLMIEAVFEDFEVKSQVFQAADRVLKPGAILATNTSYLDIDALAATVSRPGDVIGLHFFSPAHVMRLVEVVVGQQTASDVTATGFTLAKRLGKIAVRAGNTDGFIGNRILSAYRTATDFMLEDGATPAQIDAAMRSFGFPLGPYQVLDMAGLEISWARRKRLAATRDPNARYVSIGDLMCESGWFGQKTGRGYYRYEQGSRTGVEDPEVLELIKAERARKGITPRAFTDDEIQRRALAAMVNEGAKLLEEGIALRPSDIDVVMLTGYGYPRWRGGPMKTADQAGLVQIRKNLQTFAEAEPEFWTPAPLLLDLIKNGRTFDSMNEG
jgi:3-hydroxyacyl-CoA dehydrogenase